MFLFSSIHFQCLYRPDAQAIPTRRSIYLSIYLSIGQHCSKSHKGYISLADRSENVDDRDDDDEIRETADARDGTDGQTVDELPEMNDASQNEPKRRYGSKEPKAATSKRRQKDSVEKQDTGAKKAKSKAAPAKKLRPA